MNKIRLESERERGWWLESFKFGTVTPATMLTTTLKMASKLFPFSLHLHHPLWILIIALFDFLYLTLNSSQVFKFQIFSLTSILPDNQKVFVFVSVAFNCFWFRQLFEFSSYRFWESKMIALCWVTLISRLFLRNSDWFRSAKMKMKKIIKNRAMEMTLNYLNPMRN